jgi:hypothetical protein
MFRIHWQAPTVGNGAMRPAFRRASVILPGALTVAAVLAFAASALAVSGTPINIGTPYSNEEPSVAVDSAGTAYIAWANTRDLAPVTTNIVQYCVLPASASACSHTANLAPADNGGYIDGVHVLVDGSTIVILADVYGTSGSSGGEYIPEQEWQSTDSGATFTIVNNGLSVADGILSADTGPLSAVVVPGTNALGFGWNSAAGNEKYGAVPTFDEFPLTSPPECSIEKCPAAEAYAALEPNTNPDQISNAGGRFASQLGATPGVLGIFNTGFGNGPLACAPGSGTAYAYGSGEQSASNSYDISPGLAKSAWKVPVAQADCNVNEAAVAGGPSGFGVLENDTAHNNIVYHRFDQTNENFDMPLVTIAANQGEQDPAVSQDGAGGVYATFLLGGGGGPISLAYSSNGGTSWIGPAALNPNTDGGANKVTSSVGPTGQGWAAWVDNGSVYAQQFVASDATPPPIPTPAPAPAPAPPTPNSGYTIESIVGNSNGTVTITFVPTQAGEATLVVTVPTASIASVAKSKRCKHGQVKIKGRCLPSTTVTGKASASGTAGVPLKLTVYLSSKIKALLKKGRTVHLTATLTYKSALGGTSTARTFQITVKGKRPHHHGKR